MSLAQEFQRRQALQKVTHVIRAELHDSGLDPETWLAVMTGIFEGVVCLYPEMKTTAVRLLKFVTERIENIEEVEHDDAEPSI